MARSSSAPAPTSWPGPGRPPSAAGPTASPAGTCTSRSSRRWRAWPPGGGFEIALAATLIVASTSATFSFPEVKLGLVAECGGLFRAPRALPVNIARELLLTGRPLTAERAHQFGVVNRLTEPGHALTEAIALAEEIAALAPVAVRESLAAVEALYAEADRSGWNSTATAREHARSSADATEGVAAFTQRRPPVWTGR